MLSSINQNIVTQSNDGVASQKVSIPRKPVGRPYGTRTAPNPIQKQKQVRGVGRPRKKTQQTENSCEPSTNVQINPTITFDPTVNFCTNQPVQNSPSSIRVGSSSPNLYTPDITDALQPDIDSYTSNYYLVKVLFFYFVKNL